MAAARIPEKKLASKPRRHGLVVEGSHGVVEAAEITALAKKMRPNFLAKCGGTYSSEWFWSTIFSACAPPEVFSAAHSWVELADYVSRRAHWHRTSGTVSLPAFVRRSQSHVEQGMDGYPDAPFLAKLIQSSDSFASA